MSDHRSIRRRGLVAAATTMVVLAVVAGPATAHVEPDPSQATKGGSAEIAFRVPNERDDATTTEVVIAFPTDHPIPSASVEAKPGWTIKVDKVALAKPLATDDGQVTEAVSRVTWSGGKIEPGQYADFKVSLESLPTDTDQLVFKALQTYSDGQVVRWIEPAAPGGEEPDHPAPTVKLVAPATAASTATSGTPTTAAVGEKTATEAPKTKDLASKDDVSSATTVGVVGILLGAIGAIGAVLAIALVRRRSST